MSAVKQELFMLLRSFHFFICQITTTRPDSFISAAIIIATFITFLHRNIIRYIYLKENAEIKYWELN